MAAPAADKAKKPQKAKTPKARKRPIHDMIAEIKKVTWPTKKELVNYTIAVCVFVLLMAVVTGLLDLGSISLIDWLTDSTNGLKSLW